MSRIIKVAVIIYSLLSIIIYSVQKSEITFITRLSYFYWLVYITNLRKRFEEFTRLQPLKHERMFFYM
jgi:hypothetical protein